jgi:hypothetical protein
MKKKFKFLKNQSTTITEYWKYDLINNKKISLYLKILVKKIINFFLNNIGLSIVKTNYLFKIEQQSYTKNYKILKIRNENICSFLISYFSNFGVHLKRKFLIQTIKNYEKIFHSNLINNLNLNGGMGFNNGLILFCVTSYLNPKVLIESGVWRGFTTMLLDEATTDDAKILCFDINLSRIEYKSKKATYYSTDIEDASKINFQNIDFAFFDDHVSHYDRLKFCLLNKINAVVLDDDIALTQIHSDGWPPIPTTSMIYNYNKIPKKFTWYSHDRLASANINSLRVKDIIKYFNYIPLPSLIKFTGYQDSSFTSLLIKKSTLLNTE